MILTERSFTVRYYQDGDEDQLVPLLVLIFEDWPRFDLRCTKKEHWKWKLKDTPTNIESVVVAETDEGKIIGISQGIFKWTKIGDEVLLTRKATEVAVHPDYRRRGVNSSIAELKDEKISEMRAVVNMNMTSNPIIINRNKRRSDEDKMPEFPKPIKQLVKIEKMGRYLKYLSKDKEHSRIRRFSIFTGYSVLSLINTVRYLFSSKPILENDFSVLEIEKFDSRIDVFWEKIKDDYDFIDEQTSKYLNWRFCDLRGGNYKVWVASDKGENILGYIVVRINRIDPEHPIGYIIETLSVSEREDVVNAMVKRALNFFEDESVDAIYYTIVGGHPYQKIMEMYGFIDSRREPYVYYRVHNENENVERFVNAEPHRLNYQFGEFDSI